MKNERLPEACRPIRDELIDHAYDTLDPRRGAEVREHLNTCSRCRAALEGMRETLGLLEAWQVPQSAQTAGDVIRGVDEEARPEPVRATETVRGSRPRANRLGTWIAVAASFLLTLALLRVEASTGDGQLTIALRLPWIGASAPGEGPAEIARREADRVTRAIVEEQVVWLRDWTAHQDAELTSAIEAVGRMRDEDRRAFARWMSTLERTNDAEQLRTREALYDLASVVALNEGR